MSDASKARNQNGAGKGDRPRSGYTEEYRSNFDAINWGAARPDPSRKKKRAKKDETT